MNDWQLLQDYAIGNSEAAFHTLVDRYAGIVYHAALRQTGNTHAAEEVAQEVFLALAQKAARLPRRATLHGWLFRATRFAVLHQARQNSNRLRRDQAIYDHHHLMPPLTAGTETDSLWDRLQPHLDDALDGLSEGDRELVMLRFFGNQSHKAVAETLGLSEPAARKRISRALERLREILTRRGVTVSSLALAAVFAAQGVPAAPAGASPSWAGIALARAATGTAAAPAVGLLSLLTLAKSPGLLALLTGLVILTAAFTFSKSMAHRAPVTESPVPQFATAPTTPRPNEPAPAPVTAPAAAPPTAADDALIAPLDRIKAALHDPHPTSLYPNSAMQAAIASLGDRKNSALPILTAALDESSGEVRLRAVDGLGLLGPEAGAAAPLLLGMLRDGGLGQAIPQVRYVVRGELGATNSFPVYTDNLVLYTLGQIHPAPGFLPEFARLLQENRTVCQIVYQAVTQFPGVRRSLPAGGWLWALAREDAPALNHSFLPLLQDSDRLVRSVAALALVSALGNGADARVFSVAAELLQSTDGEMMRLRGMALLTSAARDPWPDSTAGETTLTAARLGPYLGETVTALADAADHTTRADVRLQAAKMLDLLQPDFRALNPSLAAALERQAQSDAFARKVTSGQAEPAEVLAGLQQYPKAAPEIAAHYAFTGSPVPGLLPALADALDALAPAPTASLGDRTKAINARQRLANAMQRLAPGLPKPLFTGMDCLLLNRLLQEAATQGPPERSQKISAARQAAGWPDRQVVGTFDLPPAGIRRLLTALKDADPTTYDTVLAKVKDLDPHFPDPPTPSAK